MLFKFVTVGLAYTAALAAAFTAPTLTGDPSGNAITSPGLGELVAAGKPYTIIWDPSTAGPVTLYFLKGPSSNAVPQYAIAEHIENSGSYDWTPSASLASAASGYGLLLVDDVTGAYQYSTQFGIKNDKSAAGSAVDTTSSAAATSSAVTKTAVTSYAVTSAAATLPTTTASGYDDGSDDDETSTDSSADATTTSCSTSLTKPTLAPTTAVVTTKAAASGNSTAPTLRTTTSAATSTQSTGPAAATGAAAHTVASSFAGLVFAAGVAVLAL